MSSNGPNDTREQHDEQSQPQHGDQGETGHSGEGAASALAHMISQDQQHRRQSAEAEDAAGSGHA